jgi:3-dehydroquinate synthase
MTLDCQSYKIEFGEISSTLSKVNFLDYSKVAVIVDENTLLYCYPLIEKLLPSHYVIQIKEGEENKNLETCQNIWNQFLEKSIDRNSLIINLGGGVIGDMGGFCAATYMRGVAFINIPTTLLAMVDASIGGKTGVDYHSYKNMIGLFTSPKRIFIDIKFLNSLDVKQLRSGYAEMLKHGLIASDTHWSALILKEPSKIMMEDILTSVSIKKDIVEKDPKEKGIRKTLNFGHTIGHAIESYNLKRNTPLLHGEAIAIGLVCESFISYKMGFLPETELLEIKSKINLFYGNMKRFVPEVKELREFITKDKKNQNDNILGVIIQEIGVANYNQKYSFEDISDCLSFYCQ